MGQVPVFRWGEGVWGELLRDAVLALYRGVHTLNRKGESTEVRWEEVALLGPTAWFGVTGNRINR